MGWPLSFQANSTFSSSSRNGNLTLYQTQVHACLPVQLARGGDTAFLLSVGGQATSGDDILYGQMNQKSHCHQSREDTSLSTTELMGRQATSLPSGSQEQIQLRKLALWGGWEKRRRACFISCKFNELNYLAKKLELGTREAGSVQERGLPRSAPHQLNPPNRDLPRQLQPMSGILKHVGDYKKSIPSKKDWNLFIIKNDEQWKWYIAFFSCLPHLQWWILELDLSFGEIKACLLSPNVWKWFVYSPNLQI